MEEAWRFAPARQDGGNVPAHLRGSLIQGALDLYRPRTGDGLDVDMPCVVDFNTHQISADDVGEIAVDYRIQVATYRDAVTALAGRTPRVLLHFTHPNVAIEA